VREFESVTYRGEAAQPHRLLLFLFATRQDLPGQGHAPRHIIAPLHHQTTGRWGLREADKMVISDVVGEVLWDIANMILLWWGSYQPVLM
jgi:hypothetical protein